MKIDRLALAGVTTHASTVLDLPDTGIVLVTGSNGSGKSSLIEAVPLCLWGKTLRGADLWASPGASVSVTVDGTEYTRAAKGRTRLTWDGAPKHESTKEAQLELDGVHGPLDQWRRACVLSTADASTFTNATDAERKRLLEALTGAERLEDGYRVALARAKQQRRELDAAAREVDILTERAQGCAARLADLADADGTEPPEPPEPPGPDYVTQLTEMLTSVQADEQKARAALRAAELRLADAAAARTAALKARARVDHAECPTCGQGIPTSLLDAATAEVESAECAHRSLAAEVTERVVSLTAEQRDLADEREELRAELQAIEVTRRQLDAYNRDADRRSKLGEIRTQVLTDIATVRAELVTAQARADELDVSARRADAAARVLSTKGVRSHLLARTIGAVEAAANAWLGEICGERLQLKLAPYGETKSGTVKDAVALSITMDGSDRGYANASGGERRRVDVALCFALAEVAEVSHGLTGSTIFADEIFDALDLEGRARVSAALVKLAHERCVVVVAHDAAEQLRSVADVHWRVLDGALVRG